ncbi:Signal recognition particle protein, partial [Quaeritorhiza haematococci]
MVYIENWSDFENAAIDLYSAAPTRTRYLTKYRHVDGQLVLKVTDDVTESLRTLAARRDKDLERAKEVHTLTIAQGEADRDERLRQINEVYARKLRENAEERDRRSREAAETHARKAADLKAKAEAGAIQLEEGHATAMAQ